MKNQTKTLLIATHILLTSYIFSTPLEKDTQQKKAIVIGASSGIGRALTKVLAQNGYVVGITARRKHLLESLAANYENMFVQEMDVAEPETAQEQLKKLIAKMGGLDLLIINAGTGSLELNWKKQRETIDVNILGFSAIANVGIHYFIEQESGHIVGISSIAALRASSVVPLYNASKAFVSNYLEGLRELLRDMKKEVYVTDIQPGLVDTQLGQSTFFWHATAEEAALQIFEAIKEKKDHAYVTKRWRIIAWLFKWLPDCIYFNLLNRFK